MHTRRDFLQRAALLSGGLGAFVAIPPSILKAMSIEPVEGSTFLDAEHVVILMQENRSFDHAYGALRGVRGFDDPRAIRIPGGNPVWLQTDVRGETFAPFNLDIHNTKSTWMSCLPHDRGSQVAAGNHGKHDRWLKVKQSGRKAYAEMPLALGYYDRKDIPFYYAFADAFTVCDQHFCSVQTCTTPNRLFLWTGTNRDPGDPEAVARLSNGQIDHDSHASWTTFPERLEDAGVSWKIYQNEIDLASGFQGEEDSWLGNFGDNPMEYFSQYHAEFSPSHMVYLRKRLEAVTLKLEETKEPVEGSETYEKDKAQLEKLRKEKVRLAEETERLTPENFAKLPARERSLHKKAFTTNTGDPDQRKLATLRYKDGETEREVRVPAGDVLYQFRKDVDSGKLPAVSWLVAPESFSDHPSAPWYGAWYVSEVLEILTKNPEVWKKTVFILTYDENDGYYDHVPPFVPPHTDLPATGAATAGMDTSLEFDEHGHAIGLGYRVPMVIASPWTRGGRVCSQVFDHTSVLQFLEVFLAGKTRARVQETNISPWRRTVCGDLTSAFLPNDGGKTPGPAPVKRDEWVEDIHKAKFKDAPTGFQSLSEEDIRRIREKTSTSLLARQETGTRPSCALPYELQANGRLNRETKAFEIVFEAGNRIFGGKSAGSPFQVYAPGRYGPAVAPAAGDGDPIYEECRRWSYAAAAGTTVRDSWPLADFSDERYHLQTYGPNGFHREYFGGADDPTVEIECVYETAPGGKPTGNLLFKLTNHDTSHTACFHLKDESYGAEPLRREVPPGANELVRVDLTRGSRWYDLGITVEGAPTFARRYAGRVETGETGVSDPAIGAA